MAPGGPGDDARGSAAAPCSIRATPTRRRSSSPRWRSARASAIWWTNGGGATPVIYEADEDFLVGGSRVARATDEDDVTIVAAGITLHEALSAAQALADEGILRAVVDCYSAEAGRRRRAVGRRRGDRGDPDGRGSLARAAGSAKPSACLASLDERPKVEIPRRRDARPQARRAPRRRRHRRRAHRGRGPQAGTRCRATVGWKPADREGRHHMTQSRLHQLSALGQSVRLDTLSGRDAAFRQACASDGGGRRRRRHLQPDHLPEGARRGRRLRRPAACGAP